MPKATPRNRLRRCTRGTHQLATKFSFSILILLQIFYLTWIHNNVFNRTPPSQINVDFTKEEFKSNETTTSHQEKTYVFERRDNEPIIIKMAKSDFLPGNLPSKTTILAIQQLYSDNIVPLDFVEEILLHSKQVLASLPSVITVDIPRKRIRTMRDLIIEIFHEMKQLLFRLFFDVDIPETKVHNLTVISDKEQNQSPHLTVVGDTHGQFFGIMHIFATHGFPTPKSPYVFIGDMVDSGDYSVKVLLTLILIKLSCPTCIHFIRGNHEVEYLYGKRIKKEFAKMYGQDNIENVNQLLVDNIREIPISMVLNGKSCRAFVVHGGIPKYNLSIDNIMNITRGYDPEPRSLFEHLLWADPHDDLHEGFGRSIRGVTFGPKVTSDFLERNDLCLMVRGHKYQKNGFALQHNNKLITVYSSPKLANHKGAILDISSGMETEIYNYQRPFIEIEDEHWSSFENFES